MLNDKQKRTLFEIIVSLVLFGVVFILDHSGVIAAFPAILRFFFYVPPYLVVGYPVLWKAFRNIIRGNAFDENFLMTLATFAAFAIGEYPEAAAVMLFYQVGELFQNRAVEKSRASIAEMMSIAPAYANLEKDGSVEKTDPKDVKTGEIILVRPREKIPLDGIVIEGETYVNTSSLTGESLPKRAVEGDTVFSGCVNGEECIRVRVTKNYEDSTVAKILDLLENAEEKKAPLENFITRFARVYTPLVTVFALLLAVLPPLIGNGDFAKWIRRACVFLIVSCPCALVISVPLGFFGGIGAASKIGVLVKGGNYLETAAGVSTVVFDKTGTLTEGKFRVREIIPDGKSGLSKENLLRLAAAGERFSAHPIAQAITEAGYGENSDLRSEEIREIPGKGVLGKIDGKAFAVGNAGLMHELGIRNFPEEDGTTVHVVYGGYAGHILLSDTVKSGAADALIALKKAGIQKTVMLTGDKEETARQVASEIGIDEVHAGLLPADKVRLLEKELEKKAKGKNTAFVGDGINDAPALTRADVGIAMGGLGSDAAIEAADVVLMDDDLGKIALLIAIAKETVSIVKENVAFSLSVKFCVLLFGAFGLFGMWAAVFADVGVTILAVLNSMRTLRIEKNSKPKD